MIRLFAEQCDSHLSGAVDGEVAYIFDRACYLRRSDGSLVIIASKSIGTMPNGIMVNLPADFCFSDHVELKAQTIRRAEVLRFAGSELSIDLRGAAPYGPAVRRPRVRPPARERALGRAKIVLSELVVPRAAEAVALFSAEPQMVHCRSASYWIGRGPGLTPAGDDYLIGLLAAYWFAASETEGAFERRAPIRQILDSIHCTGDVSQTLLIGATRGEFPARLMQLATLLEDGEIGSELDTRLNALVAFGHSSGASMAYGLLSGYQTILTTEMSGRAVT